MTNLTIGQEFTERWMAKRNPRLFNSETLMRDMINAVDEYVKSKPAGMESLIREIALEAVEGNDSAAGEKTVEGETMSLTARQFLRCSELVAVANKHHLGGPQTWQFPV